MGSQQACRSHCQRLRDDQGFTLVELMVVFAIAALVMAVAVPYSARMYDTMQYRATIREISAAAASARYQAITSGQAADLVLDAEEKRLAVSPALASANLDPVAMEALDGDLQLDVISAAEVSPGRGLAAIRFYPQGGSTGGSVSVIRDNGSGVRLRVDWLLGRITQESLEVQ